MKLSELVIGARCRWRDREVVVEKLDTERAAIRMDGSTGVRLVKPEELEPLPEERDYEEHGLMSISEEDWNDAKLRAEELEKICKLESGISEAITAAADRLKISSRQLWRLYEIFKSNPSVSAMLRLRCGRKQSARMLGPAREDLIRDCIDRHYLKPEKPTLAKLYEAIESEFAKAGLKLPSRRAIKLRVDDVDLKVRLRRREGRKQAAEACDGVPGHVKVSRPFERVEIDHTRVDVILRADTAAREVVGRPWLTLAVCVKTRMIVGFYLSFEPPSAASVAMCLAMAGVPKADWLKATGVEGNWPAVGIPEEIWVDNALEFRSMALKRGCEQHMIKLCFRPVGSPQVGGTIERLIGTMMGMVHLLPGTTQSSVVDKGDYDAESRAVMTLSEFVAWFTEQVVTQYHLRPHRILGVSPLQMWEQATRQHQPKLPRDAREYYVSFLPAQTRKLTRTGVQIHNVNYWSPMFSAWVGQGMGVLVHFHRMDAKHVYVRLPDGQIAVAVAMREGCEQLTVRDLRDRDADVREISRDPVQARARIDGFRRNQERMEASGVATSMALRGLPATSMHLPALPSPPMALPSHGSPYEVFFTE